MKDFNGLGSVVEEMEVFRQGDGRIGIPRIAPQGEFEPRPRFRILPFFQQFAADADGQIDVVIAAVGFGPANEGDSVGRGLALLRADEGQQGADVETVRPVVVGGKRGRLGPDGIVRVKQIPRGPRGQPGVVGPVALTS